MMFVVPNAASIPLIVWCLAKVSFAVYLVGFAALLLIAVAATIATHEDDCDKMLGLNIALASLWPLIIVWIAFGL